MALCRRHLFRISTTLACGGLFATVAMLSGGCGPKLNTADPNDPEVKKSLSNKYSGYSLPPGTRGKKRGKR
jgi:hypothetical protein